MTATLDLMIVSGISGGGKSTALRALEDLGYYCIDNLPVELLEACIDQLLGRAGEQRIYAAVGLDARTSSDLSNFPTVLQQLARRKINYRILFFTTEESVLVKRFNETRRKHPLAGKNITLADAIALEHERLSPIVENSEVVDTTHLSVYELRDQIGQMVEHPPEAREIRLVFHSFGFKYGTPVDADLVFDLRCLPNPYWEHGLRDFTGQDSAIVQFLDSHPMVEKMFGSITSYLTEWLPHFEKGNRSYLNVALGCTGGRHRSVYMAEKLCRHFRAMHKDTLVRHREIQQ